MSTFTPTIGLEIHVELSTKSKMFCGCANNPHDGEPNANICPICVGHPGTLPVVNSEAVKHLALVGAAVNGEFATYSEFDRKNYFYPDIPKAYQISQYQFPFVSGGELAGVKITRIHLEEDTARSLHDQTEGSVIDFNRAGVPLMELVTEPVIHDAKTAAQFARELQLLLRTLGVADANMERGEMRIEANISVSDSETLGTKIEVKNLNSFKAVEGAIAFEVERQTNANTNTDNTAPTNNRGELVSETRGWNEVKQETFSQRRKETSDDYRYFPDPDIPRFDLKNIEELRISRINEKLPELPNETRSRLSSVGVSADSIEILLANTLVMRYFHAAILELESSPEQIRLAANYLISDIMGALDSNKELKLDTHSARSFAALIGMVNDRRITSRVAKDLLYEVVFENKNPEEIALSRDLLQKDSADELEVVIDAIVKEHASVADEYKNGKDAALQYLIGQGMKATRGAANPDLLKELFQKRLGR